jgi:uncharacterized protein (DUF736 family)
VAIIGIFTKQENGGYNGTIETLTLKAQATFELLTKRGEKSPDFRITSGLTDIGAAWERASDGASYSEREGFLRADD